MAHFNHTHQDVPHYMEFIFESDYLGMYSDDPTYDGKMHGANNTGNHCNICSALQIK